jgi:hypothetical protein
MTFTFLFDVRLRNYIDGYVPRNCDQFLDNIFDMAVLRIRQ